MKIFRVLAALLLLGSPVAAQTAGQYPAGTVLGNATGARALAAPSATPILGLPGTTLGTLRLSGNTSGTATIRPQAAAGTPTITLGTSSGTPAVTASSPLAITTATGNITCATCVTSSGGGAMTGTAPIAVSGAGAISITGAAGQVLAGAGPAFTATPVLGVAGSTVGSVGFQNATSGTITLAPVTGALGTVTLTLPARTDTLVTLAGTEALTNKTYNGNTFTAGTGVLTIAAAKTLTASNTLTLAGTDGKTLTVSNSLTLAGTDATTMTFPSVSATIPRTVASGAKALATSAISSAACSTAQTDTATGTLTTDAIMVSFSADPTATTGYVPLTTGMLTIIYYPTADTINFKVCNNTTASVTPGAVTINWRVIR